MSASSAETGVRGRGAVDRQRIDQWCERIVLGLVLAIIGWSVLATGAVRPQDFLIVQWLTVALLAVWACRFVVNPKHRLLWPWLCWPVLGFMAYAVARYLTADIEYVARQELTHVLIYGFLFFAVLNNLHHQETTYVVAVGVVLLGMVVALYAIIQYLTDSERVWHFFRPEMYRHRGSGTFINPNHLAGYLGLLLPLALAYTTAGRLEHLHKVFLGYASLMIFTGIAVSFSRWGWLAAGVSVAVLLFWLSQHHGYRLQMLFVLIALVAVILLVALTARAAPGRPTRLAQAAKVEDVRFELWGPSWRMWQDRFWWGAGPGHYDHRFRQYRPESERLQARPDRAHNDYLNVLADWGMAGGVLVFSILGLFYYGVLRSWKYVQRSQNDLSAKRSNKSALVLGGALGLLGLMVHSFFEFNLYVPATALTAATVMGLVAGHFRFATERFWHTVRWPLRVPVALVLVSGIVFLGWQSWQRTRECYWLGRAARVEAPRDRVELLAKAFEADPQNFETAYELGENLRLMSWQGDESYQDTARQAITWFERSQQLNPLYPYSFLRHGMCLHWLGRHAEAKPFFDRAQELDPNGYYTAAHVGWHHYQLEDWASAKAAFQRSLQLQPDRNPIATSYLHFLDRGGEEKASTR